MDRHDFRKKVIFDNQIKNYEKFQNHNFLYQFENKKRLEKIEKYTTEYKKKEKKEKINKEKELNKRFHTDKDNSNDIIIKRLRDIQNKNEKKNKN